jgi:hypothetical protein
MVSDVGPLVADAEDDAGEAVAPALVSRELAPSSPPWRWAVDVGLVAVISSAIIAALVRPWSRPMRVPFVYWGDALSFMSEVRNFDSGAWYFSTNRLAAPFGVNLLDLPMGGENLYWALLRVGHTVTSDPALLVNALYLLTFPMAAVVAFVCFRLVGAGRLVSGVLGILFAFTPAHFLRNTSHLVLAGTVSVPIGCAIAIRLLRGDTPFLVPAGPLRPRLGKIELIWLLGLLLLATAGTYYAIFALLMMPFAAVGGSISRRSIRPALSGLVLFIGLVVALAVNNIPTLLYQARHGTNPEVAHRHVWELDIIPLRPILFFTPVPGHRLPAFNHLNNLVLRSFAQNSEPLQYLGAIAAVGLVVAIGSLLVARKRGASSHPNQAGALITILVFLGAWGGLSIFVYWLAFPQLRGYNRVSVYIAFLALVALIPALEWTRRRLRERFGQVAAVSALGLLVLFGLWDQIGMGMIPDARPAAASWNSDRSAVGVLEAAVPPGSMIFQMPVIPFPENGPVQRMTDYDHLRPALHSHNLEWSYGGMRGRDADWQTVLLRLSPEAQVDAVTAAGFRVLWIDRFGFSDASFEDAVAAYLGERPVTSGDGRYAWFDLAGRRVSLMTELGADGVASYAKELLHPADMVFFGDAGNALGSGLDVVRPIPPVSSTEIRTDHPMDATLLVDVQVSTPGTIAVTVDNRTTARPLGVGWTEARIPLRLSKGSTRAKVEVVTSGGEPLVATLRNLVIVDRCGPLASQVDSAGNPCLLERAAA